jgi:hypothetical protein
VCPTCLGIATNFEFIALIIFGVEHASWRYSVCSLYFFPPLTSYQQGPTICFNLLFSSIITQFSFFCVRDYVSHS